MPDDSIKKTILVALGVCLVCSVLVSSAAVSLNAIQKENRRLDLVKNILIAGGLYDRSQDVETVFINRIAPLLIDLETGRALDEPDYPNGIRVGTYDLKKIASDPDFGVRIPPDEDMAGIRRKPRYIFVYEVIENGRLQRLILPIYGYGLWSTLYGFISLGEDLKTIQGITYYEHGETPGLGGEVDNPRWKGLWRGKQAYDASGNVAVSVVKGQVDPNSPNARYQVDGLSGATITTRGVHHMVRYWLGDSGYGPFLEALRKGDARG